MHFLGNTAVGVFFRYFNYVFAIVIAGMYTNALIFPNMGVDAGFYLRVTEYIINGAVPEHDLRILYTPLVFYMLLPIKLVVGKAIGFELFLGYMFIFQFINACLIYKISGYYSQNNILKIFAGLLYLFLSIKLEGEYIILEPFINFWGLLAILVYMKSKNDKKAFVLLSGFISFLAFLTKQYGLSYTGAVLLLILIDNRSSLRRWGKETLRFIVGFSLALMLFIMVFRFGYGEYYDFFSGGRLSLYGEKNINFMLLGMIKYLKIAPFLLLLLIPSVSMKLIKKKPHFIAYLVLILLFSFQLYFNQYDHYYILMVPGLIFLGIIFFDVYYSKNKIVVLGAIIMGLLINELFIGNSTKTLILSKHSTLKNDIELAEKINTIIPERSKVYLFSNVELYYLCHFSPAFPEKYGFSYSNALDSNDLLDILSSAEFLLIKTNQLRHPYPLIDKIVIPEELINLKDYKLIHQFNIYLIFHNSSYNNPS